MSQTLMLLCLFENYSITIHRFKVSEKTVPPLKIIEMKENDLVIDIPLSNEAKSISNDKLTTLQAKDMIKLLQTKGYEITRTTRNNLRQEQRENAYPEIKDICFNGKLVIDFTKQEDIELGLAISKYFHKMITLGKSESDKKGAICPITLESLLSFISTDNTDISISVKQFLQRFNENIHYIPIENSIITIPNIPIPSPQIPPDNQPIGQPTFQTPFSIKSFNHICTQPFDNSIITIPNLPSPQPTSQQKHFFINNQEVTLDPTQPNFMESIEWLSILYPDRVFRNNQNVCIFPDNQERIIIPLTIQNYTTFYCQQYTM